MLTPSINYVAGRHDCTHETPFAVQLVAEAALPLVTSTGDGIRISLLSRLCNGQPESIAQLMEGTGLTRQGVRKHLAILENAHVITSERVGPESRFAVQTTTLTEVRRYLDQASQRWGDAIGRLKQLVENDNNGGAGSTVPIICI